MTCITEATNTRAMMALPHSTHFDSPSPGCLVRYCLLRARQSDTTSDWSWRILCDADPPVACACDAEARSTLYVRLDCLECDGMACRAAVCSKISQDTFSNWCVIVKLCSCVLHWNSKDSNDPGAKHVHLFHGRSYVLFWGSIHLMMTGKSPSLSRPVFSTRQTLGHPQ